MKWYRVKKKKVLKYGDKIRYTLYSYNPELNMKIPTKKFKTAIFIQFLDNKQNIEIQKTKDKKDYRFIIPYDNIAEIHVGIYIKKADVFDLNLDRFLENFNVDIS